MEPQAGFIPAAPSRDCVAGAPVVIQTPPSVAEERVPLGSPREAWEWGDCPHRDFQALVGAPRKMGFCSSSR